MVFFFSDLFLVSLFCYFCIGVLDCGLESILPFAWWYCVCGFMCFVYCFFGLLGWLSVFVFCLGGFAFVECSVFDILFFFVF